MKFIEMDGEYINIDKIINISIQLNDLDLYQIFINTDNEKIESEYTEIYKSQNLKEKENTFYLEKRARIIILAKRLRNFSYFQTCKKMFNQDIIKLNLQFQLKVAAKRFKFFV